jgi:hypothetical protein
MLNADESLRCPVCGLEDAFPEPRAWEECPRCGWYDDPVQYRFPDADSGDNEPMTLNQARKAWALGQRVDEWRVEHMDELLHGRTPAGFPPPQDMP